MRSPKYPTSDSEKATGQLNRTNDLQQHTNARSPCRDNDRDTDPRDVDKFLKKWDIDSQKEIDLVKLLKRLPRHVLRQIFLNFPDDRRDNYRSKDFAKVLWSFTITIQAR